MANLLRILFIDDIDTASLADLAELELNDLAETVTRQVHFFGPEIGLACWDRNQLRAMGMAEGPKREHVRRSSSPFPQFSRRGSMCDLGLRKGYDGNRVAHDLFSRASTGKQSDRNSAYDPFKEAYTVEHLISEDEDETLARLHHSSAFWCVAVPRAIQPITDKSRVLRWLMRQRVSWSMERLLAAKGRSEKSSDVLTPFREPLIPPGSWTRHVLEDETGRFWGPPQPFAEGNLSQVLQETAYGSKSFQAWATARGTVR